MLEPGPIGNLRMLQPPAVRSTDVRGVQCWVAEDGRAGAFSLLVTKSEWTTLAQQRVCQATQAMLLQTKVNIRLTPFWYLTSGPSGSMIASNPDVNGGLS